MKTRLKSFILMPAVVLAALALVCFPATSWAAQDQDIADEDIASAITMDLTIDSSVASHLVNVEVKNGVVTLSGTVDNLLAKDRAVEVAESIKGVRSVVNMLSAKTPNRPDNDVRKDVDLALAADPAADSYQVTVAVKDGTVTLSGKVDSWQEKRVAERVAKSVLGVKDVKNKLMVEYTMQRTDSDIKSDIERRLEINTLIDDLLIDVAVKDGKVTLSGAVGSAAEKARARTNAWVAGVHSVDAADLEVRWWARDDMRRSQKYPALTDDEIKQAIRDAFLYDPRVLSFNPKVTVDDGTVTLSGTVTDYAAKRAAEDTALNTLGVWRVKNQLRVRPQQIPTDAELARRVREALKRDPYIERWDVHVAVVNGKVFLTGDVNTFFEKTRAETVASSVKGVVDVSNTLTVNASFETKSDLELASDIRWQLYWNPYIESDDVNVDVEDGVVTLTGKVGSWYEYRQATQDAMDAGAERVHNHLKVKSGKSSSWRFW
jgi:osmotically-inducible protein OsmY